jgi:hypothetical protein
MDIILDVENVCFEFGNSFEFEGINLETIQLSLNLLESLFSMNDDLFVDLVNPQMLQCIIYRLEQTSCNFLSQRFVSKKRFIRYNKTTNITLMKTHFDYLHKESYNL